MTTELLSFIDESWQSNTDGHVGVLAAVTGRRSVFDDLARRAFELRRKYYGDAHARNLRHELKGRDLFSNSSFKLAEKGYSKNQCIARELLEFAAQAGLKVAVVSVFGAHKPALLSADPKQLSAPFRELCLRLICSVPKNSTGQLIFDQRLGAQEDISIAVHNYLAGIKEPRRLLPLPLVAVSNVAPGLQLADIIAHVIGRHGLGEPRFATWYRLARRLQVEGLDHHGRKIYGFVRIRWLGGEEFVPFRSDKKNESGSSGKEE